MRKEILVAIAGALAGAAATFGFELLKDRYVDSREPLGNAVADLTGLANELKAQTNVLAQLSQPAAASVGDTVTVNTTNIVQQAIEVAQTANQFTASAQAVIGLARSTANQNKTAIFNSAADVTLAFDEGVTVCGNENTLGVSEGSSGQPLVSMKGRVKQNIKTGHEFVFRSPQGPSLVGYLGKVGERYAFRITCNTSSKNS